jgi:hypothetical protein
VWGCLRGDVEARRLPAGRGVRRDGPGTPDR